MTPTELRNEYEYETRNYCVHLTPSGASWDRDYVGWLERKVIELEGKVANRVDKIENMMYNNGID